MPRRHGFGRTQYVGKSSTIISTPRGLVIVRGNVAVCALVLTTGAM
jgi:hypothetical protein